MVSTDFPYRSPACAIVQGGGGACISQLVGGLLEKGVGVSVVTRSEPDLTGEIFPCPIYRTRFAWLGFRESKITHSLFVLPKLLSLLASEHFDVIHAHNPAAAIPSILACAVFRKPLLLTMHGPWSEVRQRGLIRWIARRIQGITLRLASRVACDSRALRDELLLLHPRLPKEKLAVIPNAVDTRFFSPLLPSMASARKRLGLPKNAFVILFTGRFVSEKGLPFLLEAARALPGDGFFLLLIGGGFDEHIVMDWLKENKGMRSKVKCLPYLPYERMPLAYRASDAFVLPTLAEGLSRSIMEALASGVPVIATNVGGNPELVKHGFNGFLVPPRDSKAIAEAIIKLASNPSLSKKMRKNARSFAEKSLSVKKRIDAYIREYRRLAG